MKYLFDDWRELRKQFSGKSIFLFLDYDGTLTPIADSPNQAVLSSETRTLLKKLKDSSRCKIAIISGRKLVDIKNRVGLDGVIYVGNHGLEIEGPKIKFKSPISSRYLRLLQRIKGDLERKVYSISGVFIEDKGLILSLHYRQADEKDVPRLKTIFHETIIYYLVRDDLRIKPGKKVLEIRPPVNWDKGKVTLWLLARQCFALKDKVDSIPFYIGDDVTDEDAFQVLKDKGLTVRVGESEDSHARYYVKNPNEVIALLEDIEKILV